MFKNNDRAHESRLDKNSASKILCLALHGQPYSSSFLQISSFPHPSLPPDPLTPRRQSEFWPSTVRRAQKQFHSKRFLVIFFLLHRLASHFSVSTPSFPAVFLTMFLTPSGMQA